MEFRRRLLAKSPRLLGVLELAAEKAGWGKPLPAGRGRGIAVVNNVGSYIAQVAEVSVEQGKLQRASRGLRGGLRAGRQPAVVEQQIRAASSTDSVGGAQGRHHHRPRPRAAEQLHQYDVLRIDEMPEVEVHIVPSQAAPGGIGEASTPAIAPAVANAIFAAPASASRKLPVRPRTWYNSGPRTSAAAAWLGLRSDRLAAANRCVLGYRRLRLPGLRLARFPSGHG